MQAKEKLAYMENVFETTHPLIQHKISILRNKNTGTNEFREIVNEIGMLMGYEALSDLPTHFVEVDTPIATCLSPMLEGRKLAIIPILRAGLGMMNGVLKLVPSAKVGHIEDRIIVVTEPMVATGGSAISAVDLIKQKGGKKIKFMSIIGSKEGIQKLHAAHPDIQIYVGCIDPELNKDKYITPGLGDAGDRIFGTK